jgi:DNA-binding MarR family transcriptional regulator
MNIPITGEIGELAALVRAKLIDHVERRLRAGGYTDVRAIHDCVFRYLGPGGSRLRDLASQAQMAPQSIGWHVDELERLGYVERVPDPSDRRAKLIRPTEHGLAYMAAARDALAEIEREWVSAVGTETVTRLRDAMREIASLEADMDVEARPPR